ncbi:histidine kinase [Methylobacterium brachythecii]|uniref:Histidine kinase n=2 Tax=Methylobacterium brachythecii TaxID=1176177 RepID=A0ABQ6D272_9HYPH|nr:histidine kinase [Methylobacterium brachythecii]
MLPPQHAPERLVRNGSFALTRGLHGRLCSAKTPCVSLDGGMLGATQRSGRLRSTVAILALASGLSACAVGPDYMAPADPAVTGYTREPLKDPHAASGMKTTQGGSADQDFVKGADIPGQWWTLFRSKALNRLVEEALANNPSIDAAQASLRMARENVEAQKGTLFPTVGFNGQGSYNKAAGGQLQGPLNDPTKLTYSLFTPQVQVAFTPDVFGGNRRQIEGLEATAENQRFQLEAAYLTLTSNVVLAAIQEASLRAQIDATKKVIAAQVEVLNLYNKQLSLGQIASADVIQQQAQLSVSQQLLPPLQKQLAQQRNLLTALVGRLPSDEVSETFTLASLRLPTKIPVSLPSRLVQQRPDVKAAEGLVQQASAGIGVAVANRLPQFTISANGGSSALQIAKLATSAAGFYSIIGTVAQPIFDAGTLYRRQRASEEALTVAQAQYRQTVITAFQNVADTLRALQSDADAVAAASAAEKATSESVGLIRKQFEAGAINSAQLLIGQQAYLSALVTSASARANQYADTVALFQALGGGWWNRMDVAPPRPEKELAPFL